MQVQRDVADFGVRPDDESALEQDRDSPAGDAIRHEATYRPANRGRWTVARYKYLVFTNARDARDDEFNQWYDGVHLAEVVAVPGFTGAERYAIRPQPGEPAPSHRYLAVYDMETDDVSATLAELMRRGTSGGFQMTDALADGAVTRLYEVITPHRAR
jgi:hypothetical protein